MNGTDGLAGKAAAIEGELLQVQGGETPGGVGGEGLRDEDFILGSEAFIEPLRKLFPRIAAGFVPNWKITSEECEGLAAAGSPVAAKWVNKIVNALFPDGVATWLKENPEEAKLAALLALVVVPRIGVPFRDPNPESDDGEEKKPA